MIRRIGIMFAALGLAALVLNPAVQSQHVLPDEATIQQARQNIQNLRQTPITLLLEDASGIPLAGIPIRVEQTRHRFDFGIHAQGPTWALATPPEDRALLQERWVQVFNQLVPGLAWNAIQPAAERRVYVFPDVAIDWAAQNGMTVKAHPLLWVGPNMPEWLKDLRDPAQRLAIAEAHLRDLVTRYRGRVGTWDVVNEPIHRTPLIDLRDTFATDVPIEDVADFVDLAHRWARESDPLGILVVNDTFLIGGRDIGRMEALLQQLQRRGTPFDAVGIQAHMKIEGRVALAEVWENISRSARYGRIYITEVSVPSRPWTPSDHVWQRQTWWEGWTEETQADFVTMLYTLAFGHPAVGGIIYWPSTERITDDITRSAALMREDLSPRPVYEALRQLIRETWWTRWEGTTNESGAVGLQAFYGEYKVAATLPDGVTAEVPFSVRVRDETIRLPLQISREPAPAPERRQAVGHEGAEARSPIRE